MDEIISTTIAREDNPSASVDRKDEVAAHTKIGFDRQPGKSRLELKLDGKLRVDSNCKHLMSNIPSI